MSRFNCEFDVAPVQYVVKGIWLPYENPNNLCSDCNVFPLLHFQKISRYVKYVDVANSHKTRNSKILSTKYGNWLSKDKMLYYSTHALLRPSITALYDTRNSNLLPLTLYLSLSHPFFKTTYTLSPLTLAGCLFILFKVAAKALHGCSRNTHFKVGYGQVFFTI